MKVYAVFGIYGGIPTDMEVFVDREAARRRGRELAKEYDVLEAPWDWTADDGRWTPEAGATRSWMHHWYNDERDVVVATCELQQELSPVPTH